MQFDLNLLVALDALLEEGNVTGAADRLHLSVPAMSRTLGRLRRATGDEILVRTGRTMTPTAYAVAVRPDVHVLVEQAQSLLAPARELDLAALERTFTVRCHDSVATAIAPALLTEVRGRAPGVRVRFLAEASADTDELRHGHVDLEIGAGGPASPEISTQTIGFDRLVVAFRADHALAGDALALEDYTHAEHVSVSRRGRLRDLIDDVLHRAGRQRRVVATAPTSVVALRIVAESDLLAAIPEQTSRPLVEALGLRTAPIPLDLPTVPLVCAWHRRYDGDPAHAWLRHQIAGALRDGEQAEARGVARR